MDEATANIDEKTDQVFQELIKNDFAGVTVLSIAHRLNTLSKYDKIVVLDKGKVAEMGHPEELKKRENGMYKKMIEEENKK